MHGGLFFVCLFMCFCTLLLYNFWTSRGHRCHPFPSPGSCLQNLIAHSTVQQFHCSSIFHRLLLTHALALSASQFVHKKKFPRIYTNMHSGGPELAKLAYTRLEDNLIRHRGDRHYYVCDSMTLCRVHSLTSCPVRWHFISVAALLRDDLGFFLYHNL